MVSDKFLVQLQGWVTLGGEYVETLAEARLGTVFPSFCKTGISNKPEELK